MIKGSQCKYQKQVRQNKHAKKPNLFDAFRESPQQTGKSESIDQTKRCAKEKKAGVRSEHWNWNTWLCERLAWQVEWEGYQRCGGLLTRRELRSCSAAQADARAMLYCTFYCTAGRWIGFQKKICVIFANDSDKQQANRWQKGKSSFEVSKQKWQHGPDKWSVKLLL